MRRIAWFFAVFSIATVAEAQSTSATASVDRPAADAAATAEQPRWDFNLGIGMMAAQPGEFSRGYYDDWYSEGRYSVGLGYYWTKHFKTEVEFATSGEGSRYVQEFIRIPGTSNVVPFSVEEFHRLQQTSVRAVWQFLDNAWVHPYLNAGGVFEADRQHRRSQDQFYYPPDPRGGTPPIRFRPEVDPGPEWEHRGGLMAGGGAKFYVSMNSYINTGMQLSWAKPSTTVTFLAGFGVEF